jgi:hypothetical protein
VEVQTVTPEVITQELPDINDELSYEIELLELTLEVVEDLKTIHAIKQELELLYLTTEIV